MEVDAVKNDPSVRKLAWIAWISATLFYFYEYFVRVAPSVMEEELMAAFSVNAGLLSLACGGYYLVYGPMQLVVGPLFDRYGARRLFLLSSLLVLIGCFLAALQTPTILPFALGRILMGLGSSFAFIGTMYIATVWFPDHKLGLLSGLTTAAGMFGAIIGQAPLTKIVEVLHWRISWFFAGVIGIACFLMVFAFVPHRPSWEKRRQEAHFSSSHEVLRQFFASLHIVLRNPQTWLVGIVACSLFLPLVVFADFWGVSYIAMVTGASRAQAAMVNAMLYLGWFIGGPLMGALSDAFHCRRPFYIFACGSCVVLLLVLLFCPMNLWEFGALLLVLGFFSSPEVFTFISAVELNPIFVKGTSIAVVNMIVMLLGGMMQPIVGVLLDLQSTRADYTLENFRIALLILPIFMAVGWGLSFFVRESYGARVKVSESHRK